MTISCALAAQGRQTVLRELADAPLRGAVEFTSIHEFCFGGYLRTCRWLHAVANGSFVLDDQSGFAVCS